MRSRVPAQVSAAEQFVGRERIQRACRRQLVRDVVVARRVNSDVQQILLLAPGKSDGNPSHLP